MNIGLIICPSPFLADGRYMTALGLLWVAAALRDAGHGVVVLDLEEQPDYVRKARLWATDGRFDWIGITATTPGFAYACHVLAACRQGAPKSKVMIGGPHATMSPQSCVDQGFDRVVCDDGFSGVFMAMAPGAGPVVEGPLTDPGTWPALPARDLIEFPAYRAKLPGTDLPAANVLWTMGCPFRCNFCSGRELRFYRKYRVRPYEHIGKELDVLWHEYGKRGLYVMDDEVNINREWLSGLRDFLKSRPERWALRGFIKAELFDDEVAATLADMGFIEVCTGVESGSARILRDVIVKNTTPEINGAAVERAHRYGMTFKAFCMIGHPSETEADAMATRDWLIRYRPDDFDMTVFLPQPGSPIYAAQYPGSTRRQMPVKVTDSVREIAFERPDYSTYIPSYKTTPGEYESLVATPGLSRGKIVELRERIDRSVRAAGVGRPLIGRVSVDFVPDMAGATVPTRGPDPAVPGFSGLDFSTSESS